MPISLTSVPGKEVEQLSSWMSSPGMWRKRRFSGVVNMKLLGEIMLDQSGSLL